MRVISCSSDALILHICRSVQECVQRHGGGEVGRVWYGEDVPLFQLNFRTKMALRKLLENQTELAKEIKMKISGMSTHSLTFVIYFLTPIAVFLFFCCNFTFAYFFLHLLHPVTALVLIYCVINFFCVHAQCNIV